MIDGSARWISFDEVCDLVDLWNDLRGASIPYVPSGAYGTSRFENLDEGYDGTSYGGDKVKLQILARYGLTLGRR